MVTKYIYLSGQYKFTTKSPKIPCVIDSCCHFPDSCRSCVGWAAWRRCSHGHTLPLGFGHRQLCQRRLHERLSVLLRRSVRNLLLLNIEVDEKQWNWQLRDSEKDFICIYCVQEWLNIVNRHEWCPSARQIFDERSKIRHEFAWKFHRKWGSYE